MITTTPKQTTCQKVKQQHKPVEVVTFWPGYPALLAEYRQTMADIEAMVSGAVREAMREVKR